MKCAEWKFCGEFQFISMQIIIHSCTGWVVLQKYVLMLYEVDGDAN